MSAQGTISYKYDKVGNRKERGVTGGLESLVAAFSEGSALYDPNDLLQSLHFDLASGADDLSFLYDVNGNTRESGPVSAPVEDFYDFENRLIRRVEPGGRTIRLLYDADGNRVRKTVTEGQNQETTYYLIDAANPTGYAQVLEELKEVGGTLVPVKRYTYGLDRISQTQADGTTHYYGYDALGSVRYLTGAGGAITDRYYYDAFGNPLDSAGTTDNLYLYAGEQWDEDLELYYNRARYLSPDLGRFWTMDEFEGSNRTPLSLHKYLYAHNDPVNGRDPSGYFTLKDVNAAIGGLSRLAGMVTRVARVLDTSYRLVDGFNTARQILAFIQGPQSLGIDAALQGLAANASSDFKQMLTPNVLEDAMNTLRSNLPKIAKDLPAGLANPEFLKIARRPRAHFVLFMPTPPAGPNPHEFIGVPKFTVGFRGSNLSVGLYFGKGDWYGRYFGFGIAGGTTPGDPVYQLIRMDYHSSHAKFGQEARPDWSDGRWHFHTRTANK